MSDDKSDFSVKEVLKMRQQYFDDKFADVIDRIDKLQLLFEKVQEQGQRQKQKLNTLEEAIFPPKSKYHSRFEELEATIRGTEKSIKAWTKRVLIACFTLAGFVFIKESRDEIINALVLFIGL